MRKYCVLVDAYSAGNLLAPEFIKRGFSCIHVQSTPEIWPIFLPSYRATDFEAHLKFNGNIETLVNELLPYRPKCVLPGTETGVELADLLSEQLGLPGNGTQLSEARRDKYLMVETCRAAGLRVAQQFRAESISDLILWYRRSDLKKVVVKPLKSAGTDRVAVCGTLNEVESAAQEILGSTNMLGLANQAVLIQEFLEGVEYFLDTVSLAGNHHFTDIWRYQKRSINGTNCVYDKNILCPSDGRDEMILQNYVRKVLDALHIQFGPAHTEVMLGPQGPVLVEIGARLDGLSVPVLNRAAIGYSPVELTADVYSNRESFQKIASSPYPILRHARTVYFTSYEDGVVEAVPGEAKVRALRSFFQMRLRVAGGSPIKKTTNYFTAPGFVSLAHEDPSVLEEDYALIRKWELEKEGLFHIVQQS